MKKYLVGGAVRDSLLKLPIKERDWVVVGTTLQNMLSSGYKQVGKGFPVFLHPYSQEEHALARTEYKSSQGYTGFTCYFSPEVTLEEDLNRRDLTINAIAQDEKGMLIDPYHGQKDINQRILRHVSHSFKDDPLRILRVARFAARFYYLKFSISTQTMIIMKKMIDELMFLSPERIWQETTKALETHDPQIYFQVLRDCSALKYLFPEIDTLFNISIPIKEHFNINLGTNTLMKISIVARLSDDLVVRFATLCHDFGKVMIFQNKWDIHHQNNSNGLKLLEKLCIRLRVPGPFYDLAKIVIEYHDIVYGIENITSKMLMKFFIAIDIWRRPERLEQIIIINKANIMNRDQYKTYLYCQEDFFREAYRLTHTVTAQEVVSDGFSGENIGKELRNRRYCILTMWENQRRNKLIQKINFK